MRDAEVCGVREMWRVACFRHSLFSHGQLYVASSRTTDPNRLILAVEEVKEDTDLGRSGSTRNVVFTEIFN